jgi:ribulose-phosphate 3-epimerase
LITVHAEACDHLEETLAKIHSLGKQAGISIKPKTPVEILFPHLKAIDLVLFMTVEPGFGGQVFMPEVLEKIKTLRRALPAGGHPIQLEVDGGISPATAGEAIAAGATVLVAGTAIFGKPDPAAIIHRLKNPQALF